MTSMTLPGLCGPDAFMDRIAGLSPDKAFLSVSRHLFDVSQQIQTYTDGQIDKTIRSDARFGASVMLSISLTLTVDEAAKRRAWVRSKAIRQALAAHGTAGPSGKLAQAAVQLSQAIQTLDVSKLGSIVSLLAEASQERARHLQIAPTAYTADVQMSLLRHLNG